eukprot:UN25933
MYIVIYLGWDRWFIKNRWTARFYGLRRGRRTIIGRFWIVVFVKT